VPKEDPARHDMAVDWEGKSLPMTGAEVRATVLRMIDAGDILAVIVQVPPNGDMAVQVFGPPSRELLDCLRQATKAYETALRGH
jgi:hypothetical protein